MQLVFRSRCIVDLWRSGQERCQSPMVSAINKWPLTSTHARLAYRQRASTPCERFITTLQWPIKNLQFWLSYSCVPRLTLNTSVQNKQKHSLKCFVMSYFEFMKVSAEWTVVCRCITYIHHWRELLQFKRPGSVTLKYRERLLKANGDFFFL